MLANQDLTNENKFNEITMESKSVSLINNTGEVSSIPRPNIDDESIPNQLLAGKTLPHSNKHKHKKKNKNKKDFSTDMIRQFDSPYVTYKRGKADKPQTFDHLNIENSGKSSKEQ